VDTFDTHSGGIALIEHPEPATSRVAVP
jgi:hypothetical protein